MEKYSKPTKGRHITFKIVMFHVKLSTDFCSFLSFKPSLAPILCRFSWNSIAVENKRGRNIVSILMHFCDHRDSDLKLGRQKDSEKASETLFFKHKCIWCTNVQRYTTCQYTQISLSQNPHWSTCWVTAIQTWSQANIYYTKIFFKHNWICCTTYKNFFLSCCRMETVISLNTLSQQIYFVPCSFMH